MSVPKPTCIVENCLIKDVQEALDRLLPEYDLIGQSSHQVGTGYGSHVEALLTFQLRAAEPANGNNGHRRKMIQVIPAKKALDTDGGTGSLAANGRN